MRDTVTLLAVSAGLGFFLAGTLGLIRFPDTPTRLHALTKADNLGLGLVVLGLLAQAAEATTALKLLLAWGLALLAGTTGSQLLARLARPAHPAGAHPAAPPAGPPGPAA
nr:monovalent cation/H(+) antiporter subunit G [Roseomonas acroporae]